MHNLCEYPHVTIRTSFEAYKNLTVQYKEKSISKSVSRLIEEHFSMKQDYEDLLKDYLQVQIEWSKAEDRALKYKAELEKEKAKKIKWARFFES